MKLKVSMIILSHLSDVQENGNPDYTNLRINFVKYLVLNYKNTNTEVDPYVVYKEFIAKDDYENNERVDTTLNKFMCNCCGGLFPQEEMDFDFDVDDDQDLCKNCNYQSCNDAPYGQE
jgi:hypothetical protein